MLRSLKTSWETASTIRKAALQHFLCEGHVLPASETGKVGAGLLLPGYNLCPPGLISKLFSITQPSMSTGNLDWKGEDHKWARED